MNLKSFPGPQPGWEEGMSARGGGLQADFWGAPTCQCWGTPATEVPKAGALLERGGQGAPAASVWAGGEPMVG